jgi:spore germination cell wall hydrolase CwlJ-like protein
MNRIIIALAMTVLVPSCAPAGVVADCLFFECRGESKAGQIAVASVIYNRAKVQHKTLDAVCLAPKQFSCFNAGYRKPIPKNERERALLKEFEAIESSMKAVTFKPSGSWTHYHTTAVKPSWSKSMTNRATIGNHVFGNTK